MKIGDRITVKANEVLGVPEIESTIVDVFDWGYYVHCDGDDEDAYGPVDHDGNILAEF